MSTGCVISFAQEDPCHKIRKILYGMAFIQYMAFSLKKGVVSPFSVTPNNAKLAIVEIPQVIDGSCMEMHRSTFFQSQSDSDILNSHICRY